MEKKLKIILIISLLIIISLSVYYYSTEDKIEFKDMSKQLLCIEHFDLRDNEFIINSDEEYQSLFQKCKLNNFSLPNLDFSKYTLLGKYASGGGCSIDFKRNVYKKESEQKIVFEIKVIGKGGCEKLGTSMNWVLIPKIPSDYTVEFQVKE